MIIINIISLLLYILLERAFSFSSPSSVSFIIPQNSNRTSFTKDFHLFEQVHLEYAQARDTIKYLHMIHGVQLIAKLE